uniref:Uncharacterized protein n=1 Tax=Arundo donax TaxID=35708 RepID=A0A0A9BKA4_ARUDO
MLNLSVFISSVFFVNHIPYATFIILIFLIAFHRNSGALL